MLDILKLKENYLSLPIKKIKDLYRIINNMSKTKPHIKIIIKGPLWKQIIMSKANINNIITLLGDCVSNINRVLKNIKSKVIVDYIHSETIEITIISNVVVS